MAPTRFQRRARLDREPERGAQDQDADRAGGGAPSAEVNVAACGKSELGAVVETLIVEVPSAATVAGLKLHVVSEGRLEQPVRLTDAVKPFIAFTVNDGCS